MGYENEFPMKMVQQCVSNNVFPMKMVIYPFNGHLSKRFIGGTYHRYDLLLQGISRQNMALDDTVYHATSIVSTISYLGRLIQDATSCRGVLVGVGKKHIYKWVH